MGERTEQTELHPFECGPYPPQAPAWRRGVARAIDIVAALVVLGLFLTPVIAVQGQRGSGSSLLRASAWVYVAIFALLAVSWMAGRARKGRRRPYVTVGMSIMDLYPVRIGEGFRIVKSPHLPEIESQKRGRAALAIALPVIVLGVIFILVELITYL